MKLDKIGFARELARRGDFYVEDAEKIIDLIIDIFRDIIANKWDFSVNNLGKLVFSKKVAHQNKNFSSGEVVDIPERKTVRFVLAQSLKDLANK